MDFEQLSKFKNCIQLLKTLKIFNGMSLNIIQENQNDLRLPYYTIYIHKENNSKKISCAILSVELFLGSYIEINYSSVISLSHTTIGIKDFSNSQIIAELLKIILACSEHLN